MTDLPWDQHAPFTRWVVEGGRLMAPFILADVGCAGGIHGRWLALGDYLQVYGFDARERAVREMPPASGHRFVHALLGDRNETVTFVERTADPMSSSMFETGDNDPLSTQTMRRLDDLLTGADFVKIDVEGAEAAVLRGAARILRGVVGVEIETNFNISPTYPDGHFATCHKLIQDNGLLVNDLALARDRSRVSTVNALWVRDPIQEVDRPHHYARAPQEMWIDGILKAMIVNELYGITGVMQDIGCRFRRELDRYMPFSREAPINFFRKP